MAITKKTTNLRREGLTYQEISNQTGIPKTKVYRALNESGQTLFKDHKAGSITNGATSYGYCLFKGKIVEDPREQKVVSIILSLWRSGQSFDAIAKTLNQQGHQTKMKKAWTYFAVRTVIQRHTSNQHKETP